MLQMLLPLAGSLVSGWLTKKYSKASGSDIHRLGSPVAAVLTAGALSAVTGDTTAIEDVARAGVEYGGLAVAVHSVVKNGVQLLGKRLAK